MYVCVPCCARSLVSCSMRCTGVSHIILAVAGGGARRVAAWGFGNSASFLGGRTHWTSSATGRAYRRARRATSLAPLSPRSSLKNKDTVGIVEDTGVELGEGEELLDTVDVSPEEIAEFFAKPS